MTAPQDQLIDALAFRIYDASTLHGRAGARPNIFARYKLTVYCAFNIHQKVVFFFFFCFFFFVFFFLGGGGGGGGKGWGGCFALYTEEVNLQTFAMI